MATIKFWQEMQKVVTIDGQDKLMIGKNSTGEAMYVNMEDINQFLSIVGTAVKPIPGGATKATAVVLQPNAAGQTREMNNVTGWFKNPTGLAWEAPVNSINSNWWDGSTWSLGSNIPIPMPQGVPVLDPNGVGLPTEKAVADYILPTENKLNSITTPSKNLFNKDIASNGMFMLNSGVNNGSDNWVSVKMNLPVGNYVASGITAISTAAARIFFYPSESGNANQSKTVMSNGNSEDVHFSVSGSDTWVGFNIASQTDIGDNPSDNIFVNKLQIEEGSEATPYRPYGIFVNGANITDFKYDTRGLINKENTDLPVVGAKIFEHTNPYFSLFSTSKNLLDKTKIIAGNYSPTGSTTTSVNWISVLVEVDALQPYALSNLMVISTSNARLVYFDANMVFISSVMAVASQTSVIFTPPAGVKYVGINIANVVNIGLTPTDNIYANSIQLEKGSTVTPYEPYGIFLPSNKVEGVADAINKDCYVSYNKTTQDLIFYVRRASSNFYVGFLVKRFTNSDPVVYMNLFRLTTSNEYAFIDGVMVQVASNVLTANESEFTFKDMSNGTFDHTGGYHGNEMLVEWGFYIDGIEQDKDEDFTLIPCKEAWYTQKSTLHQAPSGTKENPIVDEDHTLQAYHYKKTVFGQSGYRTYNDIKWEVAINQYMYSGICCLGTYNAKYAYSEYLEKENLASYPDNSVLFSLTNHNTFEFYNDVTGKATSIDSTLDSEYINSRNSLNFLVVRAQDVKYYLRTPNTLSQINKIDKCKMTVTMR